MEDSFARPISVGDTIYIPAQVTGTDAGGNIQVKVLGIPTAPPVSTIIGNGAAGGSTNPPEGDRPPH